MSIYFCDECLRRVQYLNTPLYNSLFKSLIEEYNFIDMEFIEHIQTRIPYQSVVNVN